MTCDGPVGRPALLAPNPLLGFIACKCGGSHDYRDHPDIDDYATALEAVRRICATSSDEVARFAARPALDVTVREVTCGVCGEVFEPDSLPCDVPVCEPCWRAKQ